MKDVGVWVERRGYLALFGGEGEALGPGEPREAWRGVAPWGFCHSPLWGAIYGASHWARRYSQPSRGLKKD